MLQGRVDLHLINLIELRVRASAQGKSLGDSQTNSLESDLVLGVGEAAILCPEPCQAVGRETCQARSILAKRLQDTLLPCECVSCWHVFTNLCKEYASPTTSFSQTVLEDTL